MGLDGESRSGQCGAGGHKIRRVEQMLEGQWEASWRAHLAGWACLPRWAGLGVSAAPAPWAHLCCGSGCCEQTSFTQSIASMCGVSPMLEAPPLQ